jgi:hypothetical protein
MLAIRATASGRLPGLPSALLPGLLTLALLSAAGAAERRALQLDDLDRVVDLSAPAASPDGRWIAYAASETDVAANKAGSSIWLRAWDGGAARRIDMPALHSAWQPSFSADGSFVAFLAETGRDTGASAYIWTDTGPVAGNGWRDPGFSQTGSDPPAAAISTREAAAAWRAAFERAVPSTELVHSPITRRATLGTSCLARPASSEATRCCSAVPKRHP